MQMTLHLLALVYNYYGLNRMLDICNKFAIDNFIIFNSKKTICIKYGEDDNDNDNDKVYSQN